MESPLVDPETGLIPTGSPWIDFFNDLGITSETGIGAVLSGFNQAQTQNATRDAAEASARVAGDAANAGSNDGTGTSNSQVFSGGVTSGASWVSICVVTLTPSGAGGDYNISVTPDSIINGALSDAANDGIPRVFNGNWQIIEELTGGGTEHVLDMGVFEVDFTPSSEIPLGEGGEGTIFVPESYAVDFTGLPSGLIAANEGAQVDIRLEIQRASGTNEITPPGLSGAMMVDWTP